MREIAEHVRRVRIHVAMLRVSLLKQAYGLDPELTEAERAFLDDRYDIEESDEADVPRAWLS